MARQKNKDETRMSGLAVNPCLSPRLSSYFSVNNFSVSNEAQPP